MCCNELKEIATLGEYKKAMKNFVRGVIKAKIFADEAGKAKFIVEKTEGEDTKIVKMKIKGCCYYAKFAAIVPTRVYNKVTEDLYTKTIEQFNKLKGFGGMEVEICE